MKVLGVVCSPRKGGNNEILMQEALTAAREAGADTELLTIWDKSIKGCDGCYSCEKTGKCHIKDDMQDLYPKFVEANGIIFASPVYFYDVPGQAKIVIDRLFSLYINAKLANKVGGIISVGAGRGHMGVFNLLNGFFSVNRMILADHISGYARAKGDVKKDKHAIKAAQELGKLVALMAAKPYQYPEEYNHPMYRLVKRKYGIESCPLSGRFE